MKNITKLFSLEEDDFFEINKCLNSISGNSDVDLLKLSIRNSDIKLFKKQFNIIKNNYIREGMVKQAGRVESEFTYLTDIEMANVLLQAYKNVYNEIPNVQLLGLLWSQAAFETGKQAGKFRLRNNNFGGVTAGNFDRKWNGSGWMESGKPYIVSDKSKMKFKSFSSPVAGAEEYIKTLGNLYPQSLKWKASGLIVDDVLYMATKNYFGQEKIHDYGGGMDVYMRQFMSNVYPSLKGKLPEEPKPPPGNVTLKYKEYGDNAYLKNKENKDIDRKIFESEKWAYNYKKPEAKPEVKEEIKEEAMPEGDLNTEYESLINTLFASGPVETLVKKALLKKKLGTSTLLVTIKSDAPKYVDTRFARILASALRNEMDAEVSIHDGFDLELQCSTYGSSEIIKNSIYEVSKYISSKMKKLGSFDVKVEKNESIFPILNDTEDNYRKFILYALAKDKSE